MHRMVDSLGKLTLPKLLGILLPLLPRVNNSLDSLGRPNLNLNPNPDPNNSLHLGQLREA